jgi:hypothetical protein
VAAAIRTIFTLRSVAAHQLAAPLAQSLQILQSLHLYSIISLHLSSLLHPAQHPGSALFVILL